MANDETSEALQQLNQWADTLIAGAPHQAAQGKLLKDTLATLDAGRNNAINSLARMMSTNTGLMAKLEIAQGNLSAALDERNVARDELAIACTDLEKAREELAGLQATMRMLQDNGSYTGARAQALGIASTEGKTLADIKADLKNPIKEAKGAAP